MTGPRIGGRGHTCPCFAPFAPHDGVRGALTLTAFAVPGEAAARSRALEASALPPPRHLLPGQCDSVGPPGGVFARAGPEVVSWVCEVGRNSGVL